MSWKRVQLLLPYAVGLTVIALVAASNRPMTPRMDPGRTHPWLCAACGMKVDPATGLRVETEMGTQFVCSPACRDRLVHVMRVHPADTRRNPSRLIDVVCHMEVNARWGIETVYKGKAYHFCTDNCKKAFERDPERYLIARCLVCKRPLGDRAGWPATYLGHTYRLCSEAHRAEFKRDPASYFMHSMWGIPPWLYYVSIAAVLVVSFGVFDWLSGHDGAGANAEPTKPSRRRIDNEGIRGEGERLLEQGGSALSRSSSGAVALPIIVNATARRVAARAGQEDRFDLLSIRLIAGALRSRVFRFTLQAIVVALFFVIVAAGLFGNQNASLNIAPMLTWTIWWALLIILILFAGKAWCYVCPWDAVAGWAERLSFWRKQDEGISLNLKWPRYVRNILIATLLFVGLTWVELGFGVTMKPRVTAYLALGMLAMAVGAALLFDKKSFCRYGCLVGRVSGLYALFSSTEVRSKSKAVCQSCHTKECVRGSETAYGCPTFLYPGKLETNTYCIQCMECIQACPHDNLAVNLRPWGTDLAMEGKPRNDEAYLALLMLAITGFHGLTMTPVWGQFIAAIRGGIGVGRVIGFSIGMTVLLLVPIILYAMLAGASTWAGRSVALQPLTYRDYFIRYAYAMLPIALFYHIAHNCEHLLMEGPKVVAMVSDPFGWGWNLLGTAGWTIPPLVSLDQLWIIQVLLVLIGHVYSLWIAQKTSTRLFGGGRAARRSQLPMLAGMIAFSVFSLWLLKQPMEMRMSAM